MKCGGFQVWTGLVATCLAGGLASTASAALVFEHVGDADPDTEGWGHSGPGINVTREAVSGDDLPAWKINDIGTGSGSYFQYSIRLTSDQAAEAETNGWRLKVVLRVVKVPDTPDFSVHVRYQVGTQRYAMYFGSESDGNPIVGLITSGPGVRYVVSGSRYHEYELRYDPATQSADLFVDGVERISDYTGQTISLVPPELTWGSSSEASTGEANFNLVRFSSPVPEPASVGLLGLGCLLLTRRGAIIAS